jgi:hypothetical protein
MDNSKISKETRNKIECQMNYLNRKNELDLKKIKLLQQNIENRKKELDIFNLYLNK